MRSLVSAIRGFYDWSTASTRRVDNRTPSPKTRQIHRIHGIGDRGSVAVSFLNLPLTNQTDHPEFWPVFPAIVLTHNYVSTAVLPSPRCTPLNGRFKQETASAHALGRTDYGPAENANLHFRLAHNQHNYVSTAVLPSPRCTPLNGRFKQETASAHALGRTDYGPAENANLHFRLAHNQFYPAHAHLPFPA